MTKALLEDEVADGQSINDCSSAPSRSWLQSLIYGQTREDSVAMPSLISTGFLYTLRDDSALTLWLTLDGREDNETVEGNDRNVHELNERQTSRNDVFNGSTAIPSNFDDTERCVYFLTHFTCNKSSPTDATRDRNSWLEK